ncbi:Amino-acid permease [Venturia nashicola]|uniref:ATPase synthesis protein 25 n=1 Tax=Venturia nashicola TaxID=86259 RepID=A0A4Z1PNX4_9PEZI|nr:Amino-acid permease [Venturia nashicola]
MTMKSLRIAAKAQENIDDALSAYEAGLFTDSKSRAPSSTPAFQQPLKNRVRDVEQEKSLPPRTARKVQKMEEVVEEEALEDTTESVSTPSELPPVIPEQLDPTIPWYLQVQQPKRQLDVDHPMAERQRLPEMPPESPPELAAILEHLSVDIGLDYLTLLDLRALNPPPALGANLLMIIGTARSDKHLHVSADRFCRHLRTNHKLKPYADGLLGRNELKLKMKRKNRRAKLVANAGVVSPENVDDGIRTGWVCVHAGQIEPAEGVEKDIRPIEGFVGFGSETNKVTIVVQMLTEEKREELDLEGLWNTMLGRNIRRQSYRQEGEEEFEAALEAGTATVVEPGSVDGPPKGDMDDWSPRNTKPQEARTG